MPAVDNDMDLSVLFPSEYLKCDDLKGKQVTVTISRVVNDLVQMSGGKKQKKLVLHLEKTHKKIIVGKTNSWSLGLLISTNARDWAGKRMTLTPDVDIFGGVEVPCIRIVGSPDAQPERAAAYARAWRGNRKRGDLVARVKKEISLLSVGTAPPVEEEEAVVDGREPVEEG